MKMIMMSSQNNLQKISEQMAIKNRRSKKNLEKLLGLYS